MNERILSLDEIGSGVTCRIRSIIAGRGLRDRLLEIGLLPGTEVRILRSSRGHVIVLVRGVTVALSRGIARKIYVECSMRKN
ncbi:MAG: FeoA family protein [Sulfolobales archaeon]